MRSCFYLSWARRKYTSSYFSKSAFGRSPEGTEPSSLANLERHKPQMGQISAPIRTAQVDQFQIQRMMINLQLHSGEWVEVRSKAEILNTLDKTGQLEGLPFMPQMFEYCGQRFRVYKRAHKTCDTVNDYKGRRMNSAVHLDGIRCDGAAYGGCEAACLIFWKEAWLKRVAEPNLSIPISSNEESSERAASISGCREEDVWAG